MSPHDDGIWYGCYSRAVMPINNQYGSDSPLAKHIDWCWKNARYDLKRQLIDQHRRSGTPIDDRTITEYLSKWINEQLIPNFQRTHTPQPLQPMTPPSIPMPQAYTPAPAVMPYQQPYGYQPPAQPMMPYGYPPPPPPMAPYGYPPQAPAMVPYGYPQQPPPPQMAMPPSPGSPASNPNLQSGPSYGMPANKPATQPPPQPATAKPAAPPVVEIKAELPSLYNPAGQVGIDRLFSDPEIKDHHVQVFQYRDGEGSMFRTAEVTMELPFCTPEAALVQAKKLFPTDLNPELKLIAVHYKQKHLLSVPAGIVSMVLDNVREYMDGKSYDNTKLSLHDCLKQLVKQINQLTKGHANELERFLCDRFNLIARRSLSNRKGLVFELKSLDELVEFCDPTTTDTKAKAWGELNGFGSVFNVIVRMAIIQFIQTAEIIKPDTPRNLAMMVSCFPKLFVTDEGNLVQIGDLLEQHSAEFVAADDTERRTQFGQAGQLICDHCVLVANAPTVVWTNISCEDDLGTVLEYTHGGKAGSFFEDLVARYRDPSVTGKVPCFRLVADDEHITYHCLVYNTISDQIIIQPE